MSCVFRFEHNIEVSQTI